MKDYPTMWLELTDEQSKGLKGFWEEHGEFTGVMLCQPLAMEGKYSLKVAALSPKQASAVSVALRTP